MSLRTRVLTLTPTSLIPLYPTLFLTKCVSNLEQYSTDQYFVDQYYADQWLINTAMRQFGSAMFRGRRRY